MIQFLFDEIKLLLIQQYLSDRINLLRLINKSFNDFIVRFIGTDNKNHVSIFVESESLAQSFQSLGNRLNYEIFDLCFRQDKPVCSKALLCVPIHWKTVISCAQNERYEEFCLLIDHYYSIVTDTKQLKKLETELFYVVHLMCSDERFLQKFNQKKTTKAIGKVETERMPSLTISFKPQLIKRNRDMGYQIDLNKLSFVYDEPFSLKEIVEIDYYQVISPENYHAQKILLNDPILSKIIKGKNFNEFNEFYTFLSNYFMTRNCFSFFWANFSRTLFHLCFENDWYEPFERLGFLMTRFPNEPLTFTKERLRKWMSVADQGVNGNSSDRLFKFYDCLLEQDDIELIDYYIDELAFHSPLRSNNLSQTLKKCSSTVYQSLLAREPICLQMLNQFIKIIGIPIDQNSHLKRKLQIFHQVSASFFEGESVSKLGFWKTFWNLLLGGGIFKSKEPNDIEIIDEFCLLYKQFANEYFPNISLILHSIPDTFVLRWYHYVSDHLDIINLVPMIDQNVVDYLKRLNFPLTFENFDKIKKSSILDQLYQQNLLIINNKKARKSFLVLCLKLDCMDNFVHMLKNKGKQLNVTFEKLIKKQYPTWLVNNLKSETVDIN